MYILIRGYCGWDAMTVNPKLTQQCSDHLFSDKINIMQYFYLLNVSFSIFQACLLQLGTSHACASRENYDNKSRNYLIVGF